jgi:hypothetical protein
MVASPFDRPLKFQLLFEASMPATMVMDTVFVAWSTDIQLGSSGLSEAVAAMGTRIAAAVSTRLRRIESFMFSSSLNGSGIVVRLVRRCLVHERREPSVGTLLLCPLTEAGSRPFPPPRARP